MSASRGRSGMKCEESGATLDPSKDLVNAMSLSDLTTLTAAYGFTERNDPLAAFCRLAG